MVGEEPPLEFNEWLQHRRKSLDLTQVELASRAGCSTGALRKIESGERRPSKQLAALLARALEISSDEMPRFIRLARGELSACSLPATAASTILPLPGIADLSVASPVGAIRSNTGADASNRNDARLPLSLSPLIGRASELAALERLFANPTCRLLTLTGAGGIGKTRLAIEFAHLSRRNFPDGVFFIPLAAIDSPEELIPAIAAAVDFAFSGPGEPKEQLFGFISASLTGKFLLVLDNLEHLLALPASKSNTDPDEPPGWVPDNASAYTAAELVAEFLERLPALQILATSRERLNLPGEWTYELHGLSTPPADFSGPLEEYHAVCLFIGAARRANPNFSPSPNETAALARICRMVEGAPLAIELAAAWTSLLDCRTIADEIQANLDFLSTTMRAIPERHRSIRATFDHSWKLLSDAERRALSRLSVFHGGFDRRAAEQVAGATLPLLASLNAKSLVRRAGDSRYDLHEVIRQYARRHLDSDQSSDDICDSHCEYFLELAHSEQMHLKSGEQQPAARRLTGEIDNLRLAWAWAVRGRRYDLLDSAGRAFGWYFEVAGMYREGIAQFELLLQALHTEPPGHSWMRLLGLALIQQALLYFRQGMFDPAAERYTAALTVLRALEDHELLADAAVYLGMIRHMNGDFFTAIDLMEAGRISARAAHDPWLEALAIDNLGFIASLVGCYDDGNALMTDGLSRFRLLGDPQAIAMALNFMVPTQLALGHTEAARHNMFESLGLCAESRNRWGTGTAHGFLGAVYIAEGDYDSAKLHLFHSLDIFREYITGWNIARTYSYLGDAAVFSGEYAEARDYYQQAVRAAHAAQSLPVELEARLGLAQLDAREGLNLQAAEQAAFICDHPASLFETRTRASQLLADLHISG